MEFVPAVAMLALILKLIDFARYGRAGDSNGVLTQLCAWVAGVLVILLVAQTAWADGIEVGDQPMSRLGFWSLVFVGLTAASTASVVKDIGYKALDNSNSAAIPTLLPTGPKQIRENPAAGSQDTG